MTIDFDENIVAVRIVQNWFSLTLRRSCIHKKNDDDLQYAL